jgi:hypothetical protein
MLIAVCLAVLVLVKNRFFLRFRLFIRFASRNCLAWKEVNARVFSLVIAHSLFVKRSGGPHRDRPAHLLSLFIAIPNSVPGNHAGPLV